MDQIQDDFKFQLQQLLNTFPKIVLSTHTNPDGDAMGSLLAFGNILRKLGIDTEMIVANNFPSFLQWMPGINEVHIFERQSVKVKNLIEQADYIFCLDYNALHRSGALFEHFNKTRASFVLIDHHQEPEWDSFAFGYSNTQISSTSEMVYEVIGMLGAEQLIEQSIAECLYTGILTDTGSFRHSVNNAATFRAVAQLIDAGLDAASVYTRIYDSMTENRLRLIGFSISDKLDLYTEFQTAIIALEQKDLQKFDFQIGDTEGIVNLPLAIDQIRFSILITERKDHIHLSFRSKGSFSVNSFSRKHFKGGGHLNAAGGKTFTTVKQTVQDILSLLPDYVDQIKGI